MQLSKRGSRLNKIRSLSKRGSRWEITKRTIREMMKITQMSTATNRGGILNSIMATWEVGAKTMIIPTFGPR